MEISTMKKHFRAEKKNATEASASDSALFLNPPLLQPPKILLSVLTKEFKMDLVFT